MSSDPPADRADPRVDTDREPVPEIIEWLVAAALAIGGLVMVLAGVGILWALSGELISEAIAGGVADGSIQMNGLTPDQATTIATETALWLGVGFVLTGLGTLVVAGAYLVGRYRARRSDRPVSRRALAFSNAILGAVATGLLSFLPFSPILGGAVAGYVHRQRSSGATKVGALSGLLSALPLVALVVFASIGVFLGALAAGIGGVGVLVGVGALIVVLTIVVFSVGLGAIGGYLADVIASDDVGPDRGSTTPADEGRAT